MHMIILTTIAIVLIFIAGFFFAMHRLRLHVTWKFLSIVILLTITVVFLSVTTTGRLEAAITPAFFCILIVTSARYIIDRVNDLHRRINTMENKELTKEDD